MEGQVRSLWEGLENRRLGMVQRVRDLPPNRQNLRGSADTFTPVELIMHMAMSDEVSLQRIRKHLPAALAGTTPKPTLMFKIIVSSMNAGRRVPAPPNMRPEASVSLDEAAQRWEAVRKELAECLETADPDTVVQKTFLFGRLSATDLLALIESHHNYHERYYPA